MHAVGNFLAHFVGSMATGQFGHLEPQGHWAAMSGGRFPRQAWRWRQRGAQAEWDLRFPDLRGGGM